MPFLPKLLKISKIYAIINTVDKRNRQINDYMSKATKKIIDYCIAHDIGTLVIGYNETFQCNSAMNKCNNQNFVNISYKKLCSKLEYLCEPNGIVFVKQEESYTSKASFWDNDTIPAYNADNPKSYSFSGKRIQRGCTKLLTEHCSMQMSTAH